MITITPEEAFHLLGISKDADEDELTKAFHERTRQSHPDAVGGTSEMQAQLNAAREIASAFIAGRKALVPVRFQESVVEFEKQIGAERAARQAQDVASHAIGRRMRPIQQVKYGALIIAAFAGAVGWFGEILLPRIFAPTVTGAVPYEEKFKTIAIALAAVSGVLHFVAQRHAFLVEATKERLDDPENCASELAEALSYRDVDQVQQRDVRTATQERLPFFPLDFLLGLDENDKQKLLILKSIEHGLLESVGPKNVIPASSRTYKVTFRPSQFEPRPKERKPPPPMQFGEAIGVFVIMLIAATLLNSLTWYLYPSGWSWLSGAFGTMLSIATIIQGFVELAPAINRKRKERRH